MRKQRAKSGEQRAGAKAERVEIGCSYSTCYQTCVSFDTFKKIYWFKKQNRIHNIL